MRPHRLVASLVVVLSVAAAPARATADVIAPGHASVSNAVRFDWGPLAGNMTRPATATDVDTWDSLAVRECGDVRWSAIVRAMNGAKDKPDAGAGRTWVPPRDRAFDATSRWFSVYVDSSKHGGDSDISRSGFQRVDPNAATVSVFGAVTVVALEHRTEEDAARSFAIPRAKGKDLLGRRTAPGLLIAPALEVEGTVAESSPIRRVEHPWRVDLPAADSLLVVAGTSREFDAAGQPIGGTIVMYQIYRDGGSIGWMVIAGAVLLALVVVAALVRRDRSGAAPS